MNPMNPTFEAAGDISDWGQAFQFAAIRDIFKTTGIDTHVVCGNHDWADWDDRKNYLDLHPKSLNYTFEHKGWQFLGLDSTQGQLGMNTKVQAPTLQWLEDTLPTLASLSAPHVQGFVGYLDGAPVAAAGVWLSHGVAGINWVGTVHHGLALDLRSPERPRIVNALDRDHCPELVSEPQQSRRRHRWERRPR